MLGDATASPLAPISRPEPPLHRAYYAGFVGAMFACFSPFKMLAYAVPLLFTAWMALTARHEELGRRLSIFGLVACGLAMFYTLVEPEFYLTNYLVAIVTYSAFLPIFAIDGKALASRVFLEKVGLAAANMVLFEASWGILQALYNGIQNGYLTNDNGDAVEGTIAPALSPQHAGANPMFAINIALMLLACMSIPGVFSGKRTKAAVLGIASLVLASVMHVLIFGFLAVGAGWWVTRPRRPIARTQPKSRRGMLAIALFAALSFAIVGDQFGLVNKYAADLVDVEALSIPRTIMIYRVMEEMPDTAPQQPWIGLGPGQFASRAALIASGLYLGGVDNPKSVPFLPVQATRLTEDYCVPLMYMVSDTNDITYGSTQQPFFSLLSVYTELGGLALVGIGWWLWRLVIRVRRRLDERPDLRWRGMLFVTGVFLLGLIGLQEEYWEMPQAIFIGLLLLKLVHANLMYDEPPA